MSIVVVGSTNIDLVTEVQKLPLPGETVLGSNFSTVFGGKGANQALACHRAGADTIFLSRIGNDAYGGMARKNFEDQGMTTEYILDTAGVSTGIASIWVEQSGENSIVVASGANEKLSPEDIINAEEVIAHADYLICQLEVPVNTIEAALQMAKKHNLKTILNPAPATSLSGNILQMTDFLIPNQTETGILTGKNVSDDDTIKSAADQLINSGSKNIIVTCGKGGVYFKNTDEFYHVDALEVDAVDTTAAGDVFVGYFAALLDSGKETREAITLATTAAAISVTKKGAQPSIPYLERVLKLTE